MSDDSDNRTAIRRALQVLEVFRTLDADMPIGEAVSFLLIASGETHNDGGLSVTELKDQGGFALTSASRYVQALGAINRHRRPGHEIVSERVDPMDRRRKILRVTPKGRRIIAMIKTAVGG